MWPFSNSFPEATCQTVEREYDFIIIGGGTAGCALANRLSADPSVTVLLVERGPISDSWASRVPLFSTNFASDQSRTYKRISKPQENLGDRVQELYSGKVLGGTSRINSMLYTRGAAAEYNGWSAAGRKGWSFAEVSPLFKTSERFLVENVGPERGRNGEWAVRTHDILHFKPTNLVVDAAQKLGLPIIEDMNSSSSPILGVGKCQFTIDGQAHRNSSYRAFLPQQIAASRRQHLTVCTETIATRLDVKPGPDGMPQADGVYLRSTKQRSSNAYVTAKREIILCSGPLSNPQILQLSGIGPRELLESLDIPVIKNLPGVGKHLQDHLATPVTFYVPMEDSLMALENSVGAFMKEFFKYITKGKGLLLSPVLEVCIFARSDLIDVNGEMRTSDSQLDASNPENLPDIEIIPIAYHGIDEPFTDKSRGTYSFLNVLLRPESKGSVCIKSSDPDDLAECDLNALASPEDLKVLRASIRLSLAIASRLRALGYPLDDLFVPKSSSDADVDAHIRRWSRTTYHYSSTCRMAPENDSSPGVVDDELKVHGVRKLRIADSSIFPVIPSTHLQAPAVMVGQKCAELIVGSTRGSVL